MEKCSWAQEGSILREVMEAEGSSGRSVKAAKKTVAQREASQAEEPFEATQRCTSFSTGGGCPG